MRFVFSTSQHLMSKIIRAVTGAPFSHCALLYDDGWMIHASIGGVKPYWYTSKNKHGFYDKNTIHAILWVKSELAAKVEKASDNVRFNYVGEGYDYLALPGLLFVIVAKFLKIKINNFLGSSNKLMCSELMQQVGEEYKKLYNENLFLLPENTGREEVTPFDVFYACYNSGNFVVERLSKETKRTIINKSEKK
jgi:hypothetical protein